MRTSIKTLLTFLLILPVWASNVFAGGLIIVERMVIQPATTLPSHFRPPPPRPMLNRTLKVEYLRADVKIDNQIATTTIDEEFENPSDAALEGTFLFPVPKGAKLNKFKMMIGGREVEAELLASDKARQIYEDIVRRSRDPALLEYVGRDLFRVRIFPIEPRSHKKITLAYTQLLKSESSLVGYTFPLNTQKYSAEPLKNVSMKIALKSQRPLKSIYSPTHAVYVRRNGSKEATIGFEASSVQPDADFQLYFSQESDELGANLLTYRKEGEDGFFLLLASPGIESNKRKVVPKDVAFVLDTSGSMSGKKLSQAKKALEFCVENLNPGDRFEILRFATDVEPLFDKLVDSSQQNREKALTFIRDLHVVGGTAIDDALKKAFALKPENSTRPYLVIFLTDGLPTVGTVDENLILNRVKREAQGTRVFCFGIGHDVNTHLLDQITEQTRAASQYILPDEDIEVKVSNFYLKIKEPVLTNPKVNFPDGVRVTQLYPGSVPDGFYGEQVVLAGRFSGNGNGKIVIEGTADGEKKSFAIDGNFSNASSEHDFIPQLWAARRIGYLLDEIKFHGENKEVKDEVTELARKYGIVTPYTAYLIVEDENHRGVPLAAQSFPTLREDRDAFRAAGEALVRMQEDKSGANAISGARYGMLLKSAENAQAAVELTKREANRGFALSAAPTQSALASGTVAPESRARLKLGREVAPSAGFGGGGSGGRGGGFGAGGMQAAPTDSLVQRVDEHTSQTRYIAGKNFFQNGVQWVDHAVQNAKDSKRTRIQFNSDEYFELLRREPDARQWLALGKNIQFALNGTVYEIYE